MIAAAVAAMPSSLCAQCAFEHPAKAAKMLVSLTRAFVFCDTISSYAPNTATEGGVPACSPPETFQQQSGEQSTSWRFGPGIATGQVLLRSSHLFPADVLNPPSNSADITVQLKLKGVFDALGPTTSVGRLFVYYRATLDDRMGGDMTTVDVPLLTDVPVVSGKANLKTSFDSMLNDAPMNQPGLPTCSSVEVIAMAVDDPNGDTFAVPGFYLP